MKEKFENLDYDFFLFCLHSQGNRDEIALKYQEKKQAYMRITKEVGQMRTFCQVG